MRFQPVVELVGPNGMRTHYFEALIRGPRGTSVESPAILFEYARKKSRESAVDRACVETILDVAGSLPAQSRLGINVHASTLAMDAGFVDFLADRLRGRGIAASRTVVEVVEHAPPWNLAGLRLAVKSLRALGAKVALDDVGQGHSNYMMVLECLPDYLKVDRHFVHGCHADSHRRVVLTSMTQLARAFGALVVAEGVEEPADLAAVRRLGIAFAQGFLLAEPRPAAGRSCPTARTPGSVGK